MRFKLLLFIGFTALAVSACGTALVPSQPEGAQEPASAEVAVAAPSPAPTAAEAPGITPEPTSAPTPEPTPLPDEPLPPGAAQFKTDFSKHTVPYSEVLSGGPPKDGIPAIDAPSFVGVGEADAWLQPQEPVILFQLGDETRAYPLQILMWHEIVNDVVNDIPVTITFCPLCNTAIAFDGRVDGQVLDFGTTGRLRFSNLIMYDRQTESWWQQASGEAIAGEFTGRQLTFLPAPIIAWSDFKETYPEGQVLSRETGFSRNYGRNPYAGYDDVRRSPFLYLGPETPEALPAMARVLTVDLNGEAVAYTYDVLEEAGVVNDVVGDTPLALFWDAGTASALDAATVAGGRDVGAGNSFSRELDGQTLTFRFAEGHITDEETGSQWNVLGQAISGTLAGSQLTPVVSVNHFWFSWAAFRPETRIYEPS